MKSATILTALATSCLFLSALADEPKPLPVPPYRWRADIEAGKKEYSAQQKDKRGADQERLMNPGIVMPPSDNPDMPSDGPSAGGLTISDVITSDRSIGIFSGFTRDIESVSRRLDDASKNSTILAPDNAHIQKLPRRPWEDPEDYSEFGTNAYAGEDGEDRAHKNLRRFTEAHIIPQSPWKEGDKVETLAGSTVWFETKDGKRFVSQAQLPLYAALICHRSSLAMLRSIPFRTRSRMVKYGF